jgi:hypothetical protein
MAEEASHAKSSTLFRFQLVIGSYGWNGEYLIDKYHDLLTKSQNCRPESVTTQFRSLGLSIDTNATTNTKKAHLPIQFLAHLT